MLRQGMIGLSLILLAGCSGGDGGVTDPDPVEGTPIGVSGGMATSDDGIARVTIPPGALNGTVDITVEPAALHPANAIAGSAYTFGPAGTVFAAPVQLAVAYDPMGLPAGTSQADLLLALASGGDWLPLADSSVDSLEHELLGSTSHFSTFGIIAGGDEADAVAVLTDAPGAENEFDTLPAAIAWLESELGYEALGTLEWETSTPQEVPGLAFTFDLHILVGAGHTAVLAGPDDAPLVIDAAGAVNLSELELQAPGGLVLNSNRNLSLSGCTLPDEATLNLGAVRGAPFPAAEPGFVSRSPAAAARSRGMTVHANTLGLMTNVNFTGSAPVEGDYTLSDNSGQTLNIGGTAPLGGNSVLKLCTTPAPGGPVPIAYPNIGMTMQGNSQVKVQRMKSITAMGVDLTGSGTHLVRMEGNEGGVCNARFLGLGSFQVMMIGQRAQTVDLLMGAASTTVEADTLEAETLTLFSSEQSPSAQVTATFDEAAVVGEVYGDFMTLTGGAVSATFNEPQLGGLRFHAPNSADLTLHVNGGVVDGGQLWAGAIDYEPRRGARSPRGGITLDGLTWTGSGSEHVDIFRVDAPVTITGCSFTYAGAFAPLMGLTEVGGAITVSDNTFTNVGLGLVDCGGAATIENNNISVTAAAGFGISMGTSAAVSISGCTINASGGAGNAVQTMEMSGSVDITGSTLVGGVMALSIAASNVTCDNNAMVTGMILIAGGDLHFSGNTCTGVQIIDDLSGNPGLQNDPVADNDGVLPGMVMTHMDWDGNGCCDYPPEWNVQDEYGACAVCTAQGLP